MGSVGWDPWDGIPGAGSVGWDSGMGSVGWDPWDGIQWDGIPGADPRDGLRAGRAQSRVGLVASDVH